MDVRDIVELYLSQNGFDGLCSDECGCEIGDLMPCDEPFQLCEPGYKVDCDCGEGHSWHITTKKPAKRS